MAAKANFNAYHNYVTDSLHQWDLNQVLTLWGLNLATVPEVHFSNKNMDRAIVRQATMENHVVAVNIPNSLLQYPLRIYAHIGIYVGNTFTVVETVEIPVIPRVRPLDYQIEDNDGEVYSFKALENKMANMVTKQEAATITARIDTIVAGGTSTDGNTELIDLRTDPNGTTYDTAGTAVRKQVSVLSEQIGNIVFPLVNAQKHFPLPLTWVYGGIHSSTGEDTVSYKFIRTPDAVVFEKDVEIELEVKSGYAFVYTYDATGAYTAYKSYDANKTLTLSAGNLYRFVLAPDAETVTPADANSYGVFSARVSFQARVLSGKTINVLGDSLSSIDYTRPAWWEIIGERTGVKFNDYGQSGTTLAHTDDRHLWDKSFAKDSAADLRYDPNYASTWGTGNCIVERVDELDSAADAVVVMGGTNDGAVPRGAWDSTDTSTFFGALNVLLTDLLVAFAGKPVLLCTMPQSKGAYAENVADPLAALLAKSDADTMSLQLRAEAIRAKCCQYGVPCLDLFNGSGVNGADGTGVYYRSGDTLHLSEIGQERLAALIQTELERLLLN